MQENLDSPHPNPLPQAGEGTNEKNIFTDEHAGKGGSYVMENGKRVLQERTGYTPPVKPQPIKPQPVKPKKEGTK